MIYLEKRPSEISLKFWIVFQILGICLAFLIGSLILLICGLDPFSTYIKMLHAGLLGGVYAIADTATQATPLILTGVACTIAFKARLWNIGAEGQLLIGAWAATGIASFWMPDDTPSIIMIPLMMLGAIISGGLWALIAGALKVAIKVNEALSSLMLVYVAIHWNNYFIYSPWSQSGFQMTPPFPDSARLPEITGMLSGVVDIYGSHLNIGFFIAIITAISVYVLMRYTKFGYSIRLMGANRDSAIYGGVKVEEYTLLVMFISGALSGLAGMIEVSGVVHHLQERFSSDYGFTGILIAWLSKLNPIAVIFIAFIFAIILVGSKEVQPSGIAMMIQGIVLISSLIFDTLSKYRIKR